MLKWLNPVNWFKKGLASVVDAKVDDALTLDNARLLLVKGINKAVELTDGTWSDAACRKYSRGFALAGKAMTDLAEAVDPDGDEGRKLSVDEFNTILGDAQSAFGILLDEEWLDAQRTRIKQLVHRKLGV